MASAFAAAHAERVASVGGLSGQIPKNPPPAPIARSWQRCLREFGLDPSRSRYPDVLTASDLSALRDRMGVVMGIAKAEIANLHQQIAGTGYAVVFTDPEGVILEHRVDPSAGKMFHRAGFVDGARWNEGSVGTNGMGTCVAEQRPVIVHRDDHFHADHGSLTCSGAPIFDPHGALLGVLDASSASSGDSRASQRHTMALVSMSASLIGNCTLLDRCRDHWVLRFHSRPEFVGLLNESMLAINEAGQVVAASPNALRELGFSDWGELLGRPAEAFLSVTPSLLKRRSERGAQDVWAVQEVRDGRRYFATVRAPEAKPPRSRPGRTAKSAIAAASGTPTDCMDLAALSAGDTKMAYNVRCGQRVIDRNVPIVLNGETGAGKEIFARALHRASNRAQANFVAVNCAGIPASLIESELFGYKHGAFTGARREGMKGLILQADGGTLFLDEIGDMPTELQTRLLRVVEENAVVPLGGGTPQPVDLHIISATHEDLPSLVREGRFREDLYYRLNGITLSLPALREREDLEDMIRRALACESDDLDVVIDEQAFACLLAYSWPGNVRQLRHVLRTAIALCNDRIVRLADLPAAVVQTEQRPVAGQLSGELPAPGEAAELPTLGNALEYAEREAILKELERNRWNVSNTASALKMSRNTQYRRMKKYRISSDT